MIKIGKPLKSKGTKFVPVTRLSTPDEYVFLQTTNQSKVTNYIHGKVTKHNHKYYVSTLAISDNLYDILELIENPGTREVQGVQETDEFFIFVYVCPECGVVTERRFPCDILRQYDFTTLANVVKNEFATSCTHCGYDATPLPLVHIDLYKKNMDARLEIL